MRRRILLGMALAVGLALIATRGDPDPRPPLQWGLYQIYWSRADYGELLREQFDKFEADPTYVMFYRDLPRLRFPARAVAAIREAGAVPIVSLELWRWGDRETRYLPQLVEGAHDEALTAWAEAARDEGGRVLLRFGFEMNGDWFSWNGDPELFRQAWRRAHRLFREAGAHDVEWVWSPNVVSVPDDPDNDMHRYYPGDDVVDWVALDGYNFGDQHDEWHRFEPLADIFRGPLDELRRRYPGKPVMIAETASAPGAPGAKARWIREAWEWLQSRGGVRAVVWFHYDKRRQGEPDWRIDSEADALEAFNQTFASPRPGTER